MENIIVVKGDGIYRTERLVESPSGSVFYSMRRETPMEEIYRVRQQISIYEASIPIKERLQQARLEIANNSLS